MIMSSAVRPEKDSCFLVYLFNNQQFVILSAAKDLLFMLTLPKNLSFSINLLLSAQNTSRGDRTAGLRMIPPGGDASIPSRPRFQKPMDCPAGHSLPSGD
jgi:hypothetical protein